MGCLEKMKYKCTKLAVCTQDSGRKSQGGAEVSVCAIKNQVLGAWYWALVLQCKIQSLSL